MTTYAVAILKINIEPENLLECNENSLIFTSPAQGHFTKVQIINRTNTINLIFKQGRGCTLR